MSNEEELRNLLKKNNINYIDEKKIILNDLIIRKYDSLVKIDKINLNKT